jgi:hypothetical protein
VIVGLAYLLEYCLAGGVMFKEVWRSSSPDGKVDAVLMNYDAGATTSLIEMLYLVPAGQRIGYWDRTLQKYLPLFTADHTKGRTITWSGERLLEIKYEKARIKHFRNHAYPLARQACYDVVEIRETPLTPPPSLTKHDLGRMSQ